MLKREDRALYQDVQGLLALLVPERIEEPNRSLKIWDIPELTTFTGVVTTRWCNTGTWTAASSMTRLPFRRFS